jgi:hypothetical protein
MGGSLGSGRARWLCLSIMRVQRGVGVACMLIFSEGVRHGELGRFGHVGYGESVMGMT